MHQCYQHCNDSRKCVRTETALRQISNTTLLTVRSPFILSGEPRKEELMGTGMYGRALIWTFSTKEDNIRTGILSLILYEPFKLRPCCLDTVSSS